MKVITIVSKNAPGGNRTHNYSLGENCYIHLTTGTYMGYGNYIIAKII